MTQKSLTVSIGLPSDFTSDQSNIQSCISDTLTWMQSNKLKLNTEKTEMMLVGSSVRISSVGCESAYRNESCIPLQTTVTYLGVHFDQTLSMKHVSSLYRTTFLALRRIASIHLFLPNSSIEKLVASMITSRLDYCNATFTGVADEQIACIQKIQHNAAWLILKKSKRDHVTPLLKELLWLPVKNAAFSTSSQRSLSITLTALFRHTCLLLSAHINHCAPFVL